MSVAPEEGLDGLECLREAVDLVPSIVQVKAGPRGGRNSQAGMQGHGAVMPRADGDAMAIEKLRQVVRVCSLEREADDRPLSWPGSMGPRMCKPSIWPRTSWAWREQSSRSWAASVGGRT